MAGEGAEAAIEFLTEIADQLRVLRHGRLAPAVRHGLQERDQGGGCCDDDALLEGAVEQLRPLRERRRQELIARQEEHREFRAALELRPVGLGGELPDTRLDLLSVLLHCLLPAFVRRRLERLEIGIERRLHIDDEIAGVGHVHDEVGPQRSFLAKEVELFGEVAMLTEPGELHQPPQRELTPTPAYFRTAKRSDEVASLALQLALTARQ